MTTKALVIVFVALSMVMLSGVGYFAFETYKIERRIDATVTQFLASRGK